jgi:hypothetical protein
VDVAAIYAECQRTVKGKKCLGGRRLIKVLDYENFTADQIEDVKSFLTLPQVKPGVAYGIIVA